MSRDNLDLIAVQRDAALLDALSQRVRLDAPDYAADPVVGLLAALVDDVDDGLWLDVADRPAAPSSIPEQSRRRAARGTDAAALPTLPVVVPVGRRHAVRAVAALAVVAAVLSVSGVAAAVSGDPLKPYKDVINVVRGGYHDIAPNRSLVARQPVAAAAKARAAAGKSARKAHAPMTARAARSARPAADAPILGGRHTVGRQVADRHESTREASGENVYGGHGSDDHSEDPGQWDGSGDHSQEHDGTEDGDDRTPEHESDGSGEHEDGGGESPR